MTAEIACYYTESYSHTVHSFLRVAKGDNSETQSHRYHGALRRG
jgi:hypothetical protein